MAANEQYDVLLGGNGYMLARDPKTKGRAWQRTGVSDSLSTQRRVFKGLYGADENYGGLPDELDHPEVWDDLSGGYGEYRKQSGRHNHYHVGFGLDTRFPGFVTLAQVPQFLPARYNSAATNADFFMDVPLPGVANPPPGAGAVLTVGKGFVAAFTPTNLPYTNGSAFDFKYEASGGGTQRFGHRPQIFGSYSYIPNLDGSGFYQRGHDGIAYTQSDVLAARWFQVANGRLWRGLGQGQVQSCAAKSDPLGTANWSATLNLGDGFMVSDDAMVFENKIIVGFPDGAYQGDATGTFFNIMTDIGDNVSQENCRDMTVHNGMVVFAEGAHVWGYKAALGANSSLRQLWPRVDVRPLGSLYSASSLVGNNTNNITLNGMSFKGPVTCVHGNGQWLYAGVVSASMSLVYCGYEASGPDLPYVWHPMQAIAGVKISRIHVDAITSASDGTRIPRRIWVATDPTMNGAPYFSGNIYYWPIPNNDDSPLSDVGFSPNYMTFGIAQMGLTDCDAPGTWKLWRKSELWSDSFAGSVKVGAFLDATTNSTLSGLGAFSKAPKDTVYFLNSNNDAVGQKGQFDLQLGTAGGAQSAQTPIVQALVMRASVRPRSNDTITMKLTVADGMHDRQGGLMRDAQTQMNELRVLMRQSNPTVLVDLTGASLPVVVLPPVEEQELYQAGSDNPNLLAVVKVGVLDASWPLQVMPALNPGGG